MVRKKSMKHFIAIPLLFVSLAAQADYAQINDADGYTNLRQKPNTQSRVVSKIPHGTFVYTPYTPEMEGDERKNGWEIVYDLRGDKPREGWIHTSRLIPLSKYEHIPVAATADGLSCLKDGMGVRVKVGAFDYAKEKRHFTHASYGLSHYRGKAMFGTDGDIPRTHYREIAFTRNGKTQTAPRSQYGYLFNPYFDHPKEIAESSRCYYRAQDDTFFMTARISDGAAYSEVLFVFQQGSLKQVLASLHPEV